MGTVRREGEEGGDGNSEGGEGMGAVRGEGMGTVRGEGEEGGDGSSEGGERGWEQ